MHPQDQQVVIIGAGIAGLTAADILAARGFGVTLIEKSPTAGGHAAQLNCKAVDGCVQCGACLVQDRWQRVQRRANIHLLASAQVAGIQRNGGYHLDYAVVQEPTIVAEPCAQTMPGTLRADAVLVTIGFTTFDPTPKPYGYGQFADVITNLEAEAILKTHGLLKRPSDGRAPERIAFIQCVGSRDSRIGHPWCSKICCGSALRMARWIQYRRPPTQVTFFYIDVQTFGKNFQYYFNQTRDRVRMVRAIPGDIFKTSDQRLQVAFFDPQLQKAHEEIFDLVILSTGLAPSADNTTLAHWLEWPLTPNGFFSSHRNVANQGPRGIFTAGAALGPMSIPESMDSATQAAGDMIQFLS